MFLFRTLDFRRFTPAKTVVYPFHYRTRCRESFNDSMPIYFGTMFDRVAIFVFVLLLAGLVWAAVTITLIAYGILHPPKMTDGKALVRLRRLSPQDLGLNYEPMDFDLPDPADDGRLLISGWWMPAAMTSDRTAIILHGYADAKVGAIAWAPVLIDCGLNVLAIDLRAHGDSGGNHSTAGFFERIDVGRVIDELRRLRPAETQQMVLFGASMGAAVATAVAVDRADLSAVILESPYAAFSEALAAKAVQRGLPGGVILKLSLWLAERMSGAKFDTVRPIELVSRVRCSLLVMLPSEDLLLDSAYRDEFIRIIEQNANRSAQPHIACLVPGAGHQLCMAADPVEYQMQIDSFLRSAMAVRV